MQIQVLNDAEIKALNFVDLERIDYETYEVDQSSVMEFARDIESAILARLATKELPEPKEFAAWGYTAAQLHEAHAQGFAAGAAAQLSSEPVFFAYQYDDGTWHDGSATEHSVGMKHLYTRREA